MTCCREDWTSRHHIIAKENEKDFNVYDTANVKRIKHNTHTAIHTLFTTEHPQKQYRTLTELNKEVISDYVLAVLNHLQELPLEMFYKKELLKKKWKKKRT